MAKDKQEQAKQERGQIDYRAAIKAALFTPGAGGRWGIPVILRGAPGSAKTAIINEVAREAGLRCITVLASLRDPTDFLGLPCPDGKGGMSYLSPGWAQDAKAAGRAVVFLDEANTAPPSVQAALLRVVLEGVVGDLKLPDTTRFIAAMNRVEEAAGGYDLAPPLANRFGHIDWPSLDPMAWVAWLAGTTVEQAPPPAAASALEAQVLEAWPAVWLRIAAMVGGFIRARPDLLSAQPKVGTPQASGAWASPRTWDMAARALAGAAIHGLNQATTDMLVTSIIGAGPAGEFLTWFEKADLPDPEALLDGAVEWKNDHRKRPDITYAVLGACASTVIPKGAAKREARAKALWSLMVEVHKQAADLIPPIIGQVMGPYQNPTGLAAFAKADPEAKKMLAELAKTMFVS